MGIDTIRRAGRAALEGIRRRPRVAAAAGVAVLACLVVAWRLSRTAEFLAAFGGDAERLALCRVTPGFAQGRRRRVLARLLDDPVEDVRVAAATAAGVAGPDDELDGRLEEILLDASEPCGVRARAGEALLAREPVRGSVLRYVRGRSRDPRFVRDFAPLVARFLERELARAGGPVRRRVLARTFDPGDPLCERLRQAVLDRPADFAGLRDEFVAALRSARDPETRGYVVGALAAIDGIMRGQHADDWRARAVATLGEGRPFVLEAEWAQDIRPNYHIGEKDGVLCLALGEGAGGLMHWLGAGEGTQDIGSARFNLFAPEAGRWSLWARVYFNDKCSNSFGILVDGRPFANFPDAGNVMRKWHWLHLMCGAWPSVALEAGLHRARLEAWEDGCFIDRFVLLPEGASPEGLPEEPAVLWDESLPSSLSFGFEHQSQPRGTTQFVTVWVRRNSPAIREGEVTLYVPEPFEIEGDSVARVRFAEGNPLCRTSFRVRLPAEAPAGEGFMMAVYEDASGGRPRRLEGRFVLGAQPDWLSTGPLAPGDPLHARLASATTVADGELGPEWKPYPEKGYDAYRRLDFEMAYGPLQNVYLYLVADIQVEEAGEYVVLLTADDTAFVYVDGRLAVAQAAGGPGEGRMVTTPLRLEAGRRRLFVRHYQADFPDPEGPDSVRHSPNHCNLKLLLRSGRREPARSIKGLAMPRP